MLLLNKHNLAVAEFASTEASRYTFKAIHVDEKRTAATNGHYLCTVTVPEVKPENFPKVKGFEPNGFSPTLLLLDTVKAAAKALPKKVADIPELNHVAVSVDAEGAVQVAATDLDTGSVIQQKKLAGQFPDSTKVLNPTGDPVLAIGFNAAYLAKVAKAAAAFTDSHNSFVELRFYGPDKAMIFEATNSGTGQVMRGALMPCCK